MKNTIFLVLIFFWDQCFAQCPAFNHKLTGPFQTVALTAGQHDNTSYEEENLCDFDGYLLVFKDDFDGNQINDAVWQSAWCNQVPEQGGNNCVPFNTAPWYVVNNGSLFLTSNYNQDSVTTNVPSLRTKRQFPAGRFIVKAKMPPLPDQPLDIAPLWMRTDFDYYDHDSLGNNVVSGLRKQYAKEIDMEFFKDTRSTGTFTLHSGCGHCYAGESSNSDQNSNTNGDSQSSDCYSGTVTDGNWHLFEIEWDMWHVRWKLDNVIVNSLARTYEAVYPQGQGIWLPIPVPMYYTQVDECSGAPTTNFDYVEDWMFPLFANMPITIGGLGNFGDDQNHNHLQIDPQYLPYTMEIDYVEVYRRIKCDKSVYLPPLDLNPDGGYRSAGGILCDRSGGDQVPPTVDNQTPSIITGGMITVAGSNDYIFRRDDYNYSVQQNLDLLATESVTLLPGFETDLLYQANGPCGPHYYDDGVNTPTAYGNNWTIQDVFTASIASCPMAKTNEEPLPTLQPQKETIMMRKNFAFLLYPNPASEHCQAAFNIPDDAEADISIYDMTGRIVKQITHQFYYGGQSRVDFSTEDLSSGVYIVRYGDSRGNVNTTHLVVDHSNKN